MSVKRDSASFASAALPQSTKISQCVINRQSVSRESVLAVIYCYYCVCTVPEKYAISIFFRVDGTRPRTKLNALVTYTVPSAAFKLAAPFPYLKGRQLVCPKALNGQLLETRNRTVAKERGKTGMCKCLKLQTDTRGLPTHA